MHVQLTRDNADKLLKWSNEQNRSVGELVNLLLAAAESVEVSEEVKLVTITDGTPARKKVHRRQSTWTVRI